MVGARRRRAEPAGTASVSSARPTGPVVEEAYRQAALEAGYEPGLCVLPDPTAPLIVFVHDDVDAGWREVGPSMLVDATRYWEWNEAAGTAEGTASLSRGSTVDAFRAENGAHRVVTTEEAVRLVRAHGPLGLHPLCGGLDPEVAWPYLRRAVEAANGPVE